MVSPAAGAFLEQLTDRVRRDLWDEIREIADNPIGRGTPDEDEDPEFAGRRMGLGVAGFAIFYLPFADRSGAYVTSIKPWDFDAQSSPR